MDWLQLNCASCDWAESCDPKAVAKWLHKAGRLRRDQQPELEIMHEVLKAVASSLECQQCSHVGLIAALCADDQFDWPQAAVCEICNRPIPAERLAAVPGVRRCAACQEAGEAGNDDAQPEYCPRCGALMQLQLSGRTGITRYVMKCTGQPPCR